MTTKTRRPPSDLPAAPRHLEKIERDLWAELVCTFDFGDAASQAILGSALEAHQRARRCRETVDRDGEAIKDRFGQTRVHPLLNAERDARAAFLAGMRVLNLDLGSPK